MRVYLGAELHAMLEPGATFHDRYRVVRCIRSGGMGSVHEVFDAVTDRPRALKTMLPGVVSDDDLRTRFVNEAKVTAPIKSEHIVEVFDAGVDEASGLPFLVMELLDGDDLGAILQKRGPLPITEVMALLHQLAFALDRTHAAGIVHRDLKPENLFVTTRDDGSPHLLVLDFGIAKIVVESGNAKTTLNLGTPLYMSPEQVRGYGGIDRRADLYAVGHIAFALLTGRAYFEREADDVSQAHCLLLSVVGGALEPATVRSAAYGVALPAGFDAWFARAIALDAEKRFDTAREMIEQLADVFGTPLTGHPVVVQGSVVIGTRHEKRWWSGTSPQLLSILFLLAIGAAWLRAAHRDRMVTKPQPSAAPMSRTIAKAATLVDASPVPLHSSDTLTSASPAAGVTAASPPRPTANFTTSRNRSARPTPTRSTAAAQLDPTDFR